MADPRIPDVGGPVREHLTLGRVETHSPRLRHVPDPGDQTPPAARVA
jgi:hypothetical protein